MRVRCTYDIDVEVPDDEEGGYNAQFNIEENHCPGTGIVGSAFDRVYELAKEKSACWACMLNGKNKIIFPLPPEPEKQPGTAGWEARLANDLRNLFKLYGLDPAGPAFSSFIGAMEAMESSKASGKLGSKS